MLICVKGGNVRWDISEEIKKKENRMALIPVGGIGAGAGVARTGGVAGLRF